MRMFTFLEMERKQAARSQGTGAVDPDESHEESDSEEALSSLDIAKKKRAHKLPGKDRKNARLAKRSRQTKRKISQARLLKMFGQFCKKVKESKKRAAEPNEQSIADTSESDGQDEHSSEPGDQELPIAHSTARRTERFASFNGELQSPSRRETQATSSRSEENVARSLAEKQTRQQAGTRDKSRMTIVHDLVFQEGETPCGIGDITQMMKKDNWPLAEFAEESDMTQRASWVIWAKKFHSICDLLEADHSKAKQMLLLKGGSVLWGIIGHDAKKMSFEEVWHRIDEHYAALGDPDAELVKYHEIRQKEGEEFPEFVKRLKKQASQAELSIEKEQEEQQTAILERSLVGDQLSHDRKMKNLTLNDLIMLGSSLCKQLEKQQALKRVQEIQWRSTAPQNPQQCREIHAVDHFRQQKRKNNFDDSKAPKQFRSEKFSSGCRSCGKHHEGKCTATPAEKLCFKCGKPGHYAVMCQAGSAGGKQEKPVHQVNKKVTEDGWD